MKKIKVIVGEGVFKVYSGLTMAAIQWLEETQDIQDKLEVYLVTDRFMRQHCPGDDDSLGIFHSDKMIIVLRQRYYKYVCVLYNLKNESHRLRQKNSI